MTRFFQFALILTACIGGYFLFNEIRLNRNLKAEYSRLTAVHGDLDIKDPSHFYVVACPDNTRRHFRWRMFVPKLQSGFGQIQCELGSLLHGTYRAEPSEQVNEACKNTLRGNPSETNFIDECVSFADDEKAILEKTGYKHTTSSSAIGESVRKLSLIHI